MYLTHSTIRDLWCLSRPAPPPTIGDPWCLSRPSHLPLETHDVFADTPPPSPTLGDPWCLSRLPHLPSETHGVFPDPPHLPSETHGVFPYPPTYHQRPMASSPNSPPKGGSRACMIVLTTSLTSEISFF